MPRDNLAVPSRGNRRRMSGTECLTYVISFAALRWRLCVREFSRRRCQDADLFPPIPGRQCYFFAALAGGRSSTARARRPWCSNVRPKSAVGKAAQHRRGGRTFLRLARMTVDGRFHRPVLLVPDVLSPARTHQLHAPNLLVDLDRIAVRIEPLPLVQDRQVVPALRLHGPLILVAAQRVGDFEDLAVHPQGGARTRATVSLPSPTGFPPACSAAFSRASARSIARWSTFSLSVTVSASPTAV